MNVDDEIDDYVESALSGTTTQIVAEAMRWAHQTDAPELTDFLAALQDNAERQGNYNGASSAVARATVAIVRAHYMSKARAVA